MEHIGDVPIAVDKNQNALDYKLVMQQPPLLETFLARRVDWRGDEIPSAIAWIPKSIEGSYLPATSLGSLSPHTSPEDLAFTVE